MVPPLPQEPFAQDAAGLLRMICPPNKPRVTRTFCGAHCPLAQADTLNATASGVGLTMVLVHSCRSPS